VGSSDKQPSKRAKKTRSKDGEEESASTAASSSSSSSSPPSSSELVMVQANSAILASKSQYFHAIFNREGGWAESQTKEVEVELESEEGEQMRRGDSPHAVVLSISL